MEVVLHTQHHGLIFRNSLHFVPPFPRNLNTRLHSLCSGIHGQHHAKAKEPGDKSGKLGKDVIVKGPRAQRQARCLLDQGLHQCWMTVALVNRRISRQEVEIVTALRIPDRRSLCSRKDYGQRVIVVCCIVLLRPDSFFSRCSVVCHGFQYTSQRSQHSQR